MAAELILMIDSDDEEEICVIAATSIFMRRHLNRNSGFCGVIVPTYSIDEFKADFQSVLRTLESLFTTFVLFHVRRHKM